MGHRAGITLEPLISVAGQLADENGYDRFTLSQVANRVGIRILSIYNHVDGLPGLRRELTLMSQRQIMEKINRSDTEKSVDEVLLFVARNIRAYAIEHPGLYIASVHAPVADDPEAQRFGRELVDAVLRLLKPFELDEIKALHAVRGLRSIIHGFVMLESTGGFGMPIDRDESFHFLIETFLLGLHTQCKG